MGRFIPHYYVVTLDESISERFSCNEMTPIITDGTHFLSVLKQRLVDDKILTSDSMYSFINIVLDEVSKIHHSITTDSLKQYPDLMFSMLYQDGLKHCFERVLSKERDGYYSRKYKCLHEYKYI